MRERKGSGFGRRSVASESKQAIKKYFLLYEGSDTEVLYFDAIEDMRKEIELNSLIELVPIIRCFSEEGWSNPRKILDRVIQDLKGRDTGTISFKTLFDKIIDYFHEKQIIINSKVLKRAIWKTMKQICEEEFEKTLEDIIDDPEFVCNKVLTELGQKYKIDNIIQYIPEIIKFEDLTYEENYDEICLIVDRDKESFIESQYEYVKQKCEEQGFRFCVTNPCFEFWLLMHSEKVFDLDQEKLSENPKVTSKKRYAEYELHKIYPSYKKSNYKAEEFVGNIDTAIKNEKEFCEDIEGLKHSIGSNIGLLIEDMRK